MEQAPKPTSETTPRGPYSAVKDYGFAEDQNPRFRRTMEDGHVFEDSFGGKADQAFFAIYDGHGGREAVDYATQHLHKYFLELLEAKPNDSIMDVIFPEAFQKTDLQMESQAIDFNGTTAACAFLRTEERDGKPCRVLYAANCGDARTVLLRKPANPGEAWTAERISFDHKPNLPSEQERIRGANGFVAGNRVNGILSVSRALGDHAMKQFVISVPYVSKTDLSPLISHYLVIACDGVWDVLSDSDACAVVAPLENSCVQAAAALKDRSLQRCSMDNISAMVIRL